MSSFVAFTLFGLFTGAAYAIAASGLVLTYTTTRVFNIAHGAFGMVLSFVFWDFSVRQGMPSWLALVLVLLRGRAGASAGSSSASSTRGLGEAPVSVSLVVTVGLFVGLHRPRPADLAARAAHRAAVPPRHDVEHRRQSTSPPTR